MTPCDTHFSGIQSFNRLSPCLELLNGNKILFHCIMFLTKNGMIVKIVFPLSTSKIKDVESKCKEPDVVTTWTKQGCGNHQI